MRGGVGQSADGGGHTWAGEHQRTIGNVGQYGKRAKWNQLGRSRDRIYRTKITDPVKRTILSAHLDIDVGASV